MSVLKFSLFRQVSVKRTDEKPWSGNFFDASVNLNTVSRSSIFTTDNIRKVAIST